MTVHHATTFKTVTINVKNNPLMPQAHVEHDVREASKQGSLIGWQEIGPERYLKAIKALGPDWGTYAPHDGGLQIPDPISWNKKIWQKEDAGFERTIHGKAKVTPNRYITWVKLKNKATGKEIVRVNTHLVSGAFSGKGDHAFRLAAWKTHMQKLDALVDRFEKKGLDVIVGGDFNRDGFKVMGDRVKYDNPLGQPTHGRSHYDYLMHTRSRDLRRTGEHVDHHYFSDHDAVVGRYKLIGG